MSVVPNALSNSRLAAFRRLWRLFVGFTFLSPNSKLQSHIIPRVRRLIVWTPSEAVRIHDSVECSVTEIGNQFGSDG